jgi:hypothetical protein
VLSINSDQCGEENDHAEQMAIQGKIKILFVSPEKVSPEKLDHLIENGYNFLMRRF